MENTLYVGLSHQMALRRRMEIIANNIANANTNAYKAATPLFQEFLMDAGSGNRRTVAFVQDFGLVKNFAEGNLTTTGSPFDVAIADAGFLVVTTPEGDRYTRNGALTVDADGRLVTKDGLVVQGANGGELRIDPDAGPLGIAQDGTVSVGAQRVGQLRVVDFANPQVLTRSGDNLWQAPDDAEPEAVADIRVAQGMLEQSNVQPILEMTRMIDVSRAYQSTQRLMDTDQELSRKAIERLAKVR